MGRHSIPGPGDTPEEPPRSRYEPPRYEPPEFREELPEFREELPEFREELPEEYGYLSDYEEDFDEPGREPPVPPPPTSGPGHGGRFEDGEWQGGHRSTEAKRRGVSIGVIVALVAVVLVVAGVIMWRFLGGMLSNRSGAAAARCVGGEETIAVIADPAIADQIQQFANRFNKTATPVGDRCVAVGVKSADSGTVINGFVGKWPNELGERPALWIPGSSVSTARLEAAAGPQTVSDSRSLVSSPVLLAVRPQLKNALAQQNWAALPGLQTNPTALDGLNLPGWGSLRLAMPIAGASDASYLAAEAVAVTSAPGGAPATAGAGAVNALTDGQPKLANDTASTAMDALLQGGDAATSPVHAVITTEQQLYQRSTKLSDAKNALASWQPPGPTALADFPTALLSGDWLSEEQVTAASEFARFLRKPEQLADLAKAGFRTEGGSTPKSDVTSFAPLSEPVKVGDDSMRATLAAALTAPVGGPAATIMLDQSMPNQEGGKNRLTNVVAVLKNRLSALPPTASVGLWTFDGREGRTEVPTGPLSDPVNGQPRSGALTAALDKQYSSGGGAVSFTTLQMIYDDALANFHQGQANSILVITTGPHTDRSLDGPGLQDYIRKTFDPARPIAVNVIDFGSDPDQATWQAVAQASGGGYQNLPNSTSPDLAKAVTNFMS
jgi:Bacterial extracellular solute-binding protein